MTRLREALADATARLRRAGIDGAPRDARLLLAAAAGLAPARVSLEADRLLEEAARIRLDRMLEDRSRRRPVSQILGRRTFWGRDFRVTGAVLDPRPETECLVALALAGPAAGRVLDLGTGSGAILLSLLAEWPTAEGVGVDASPAALAVAAENARRLGLEARVRFRHGDWLAGIDERFDLVVCNPPYIPAGEIAGLAPEVREWEPLAALSPGEDGLAAYRAIAPGLRAALAPRGRALFETGAGQGRDAAAVFRAAGFPEACVHPDLDARDRVVEIRAGR